MLHKLLLAEDSGGKAFYNTNGLEEALARAINYGSHQRSSERLQPLHALRCESPLGRIHCC